VRAGLLWAQLVFGLLVAPQTPLDGLATYYGDGLMEQVVSYRQGIGQLTPCAECVGYVALLDAADIGRKVWLNLAGTPTYYGPLLVADCAGQAQRADLIARGWLVDVDYATWEKLGWPHAPVAVHLVFVPPNVPPGQWRRLADME
jgi:hypothetical protein